MCLQMYLGRSTFLANYKGGLQNQPSRAQEPGSNANSRGKGLCLLQAQHGMTVQMRGHGNSEKRL